MKNQQSLIFLVLGIAIAAVFATITGIFSSGGPGIFEYESIRGQTILIYGEGLYKHMSAGVAIQGIAQDYVTLFAGIPILLISLFYSIKGSIKARFILAGTLGYFFVTYLFYLVMGMYNYLFLVYAILLGASFFALSFTLFSFDLDKISKSFSSNAPVNFAGGFLIFNAFAIGLLWLGIVIPPLLDGRIYPAEVEHYTTLIVQGLDLALLLPIAFYSGFQLIRKRPVGYLLTPVYLVFLSLMMTALVAKIIYMGLDGLNIIPVVFIIPVFAITAIVLSILMLKELKFE
ncbi:MAG: hypothetical protein WD022_12495 [Balneolaceae bacterium]